MPKAPVWSSQECAHLAQAWIDTSEEIGSPKLKGVDQKKDVFWVAVVQRFEVVAPVDRPKGTYHERASTGIQGQWKDHIQRNVKNFNKALAKVNASNPTGCNEQQIINMAVAIHLGKIDSMSYRMKDFEASDWKFYESWKVLKSHPAFLPPKPMNDDNLAMLDDELQQSPLTTSDSSSKDVDNGDSIVASLHASRGPGYGRTKTKMAAVSEELRKNKVQKLTELVELQKARNVSFDTFVSNSARVQAFQMAATGYKTFKDMGDEEEAAKYKQRMNDILQGETLADEIELQQEL